MVLCVVVSYKSLLDSGDKEFFLLFESWMGPSIELSPFYDREGDTFVAMGRVCECHCAVSLQ